MPRGGSRPTLIVVACPKADESTQALLRRELYGRGCPNGLLFDASVCIVFCDTFELLGAEAVKVTAILKTTDVLALVADAPWKERVQQWIELLATSWQHAISPDVVGVRALLYDVMPAAVGADIHFSRDPS